MKLLVIVLLALLVVLVGGLMRSPRLSLNPLSSSNIHTKPRMARTTLRVAKAYIPSNQRLAQDLMERIVQPNDATATLRNLIAYGGEWAQSEIETEDQVDRKNSSIVQSQYERVTGCSSTVLIQTSLLDSAYDDDGSVMLPSKPIRVSGSADSRVTQGMLAVLCKIFSDLSLRDALAIEALELTNYFGFDAILPMGRQNTFFNMINVIQSQLKRLVTNKRTCADEHSVADRLTEGTSNACDLNSASLTQTCNTYLGDSHLDIASQNIATSSSLKRSTLIKERALKFEASSGNSGVRDHRASEVAVLLSGGVDSSVVLKLLLDQGYKVRAYYLKIWLEDELAYLSSCPWEEDIKFAKEVCTKFCVPLEIVSLQREYWRDVVQYTIAEARRGRTPNPDIMCNSRVKFGVFYDYVGRFHAKIATGHYAQVKLKSEYMFNHLPASDVTSNNFVGSSNEAEVVLLRSPDPVKDQSYFLCNLTQEQLRRCMFPIGHLHKSNVRDLAMQFDLPTKNRKDSQGICFLGKIKFDDFIEHYLGTAPGPIYCVQSGVQLGEHRGLWFHTIGQRKGLGLLLNHGTVHTGPWYVCGKDLKHNILLVSNSTRVDTFAPYSSTHNFVVENVNWLNGLPTELIRTGASMRVQLKLRHSPEVLNGTISVLIPSQRVLETCTVGISATDSQSGWNGHREICRDGKVSHEQDECAVAIQVESEGQMRVVAAPGQFAAFYQGEVCIGSGVLADFPVVEPSTHVVDNFSR